IIVMMTIYAAIVLGIFIRKFQKNVEKDFYSYHNITLLGMIIFVSVIIMNNLIFALNRDGILDFIRGILTSSAFIIFLIPPAILVGLGVFISNIVLMVKEGINKKNILGSLFSFLYLIFLVFPFFFEGFLQIQTFIDVHRETGLGNYLSIIVTNFCYSVTAYMTMILIATIIMGIRAAHRMPAFDKDYILILGCRIRKDGQVTPLLKARADAAIRFAALQKESAGKDVCFVPSGGKGNDEMISEAEAVRNYLISQNVDENMILVEDKSSNTAENFSFSLKKIGELHKENDPRIAFATSGYHVFRSGYIASGLNIHAEGIGAKTRAYFWINAFIRELIATLIYEKKKHLLVVLILLGAVIVMGSLLFFSIDGAI
ncbi:MAG: YdcF family protein, partial [Lachnospiraceae bacterium]|nr:YdcF family protein [Lachnospiraceae bacterium]